MSAEVSLLGLPAHLSAQSAQALRAALAATWFETVGAHPTDLESDLELCRRWFDPVAQGHRLRRELGELKDLSDSIEDPGPPLTFYVTAKKRLVTPEGRCALDLLDRLPSSAPNALGDDLLIPYDRILARLYQTWSRHRLQTVVDLLAGSTKPLQIPAAGVVIALLVNRCTSEDRALARFSSGPKRETVDRAFFAPVQAFADTLAPHRRGNRNDPKLVSGWMLYEARRRLGEGLVVVDARGGTDGKVWISPEAEPSVIDGVSRDLARGHRARVSIESFDLAFDRLVAELRTELPKLAAFGLVFERPRDTERLRQRFIDRLRHHLEVDV